jgi:hypothetical protein
VRTVDFGELPSGLSLRVEDRRAEVELEFETSSLWPPQAGTRCPAGRRLSRP